MRLPESGEEKKPRQRVGRRQQSGERRGPSPEPDGGETWAALLPSGGQRRGSKRKEERGRRPSSDAPPNLPSTAMREMGCWCRNACVVDRDERGGATE